MADAKRTVVVSVLGTQLDSGKGPSRWERWRPSVALCQHDDLLVDELWLLFDPRAQGLAYLVREDIAQVSPDTQVHVEPFALGDPWDFGEVYGALFDFAAARAFDPAKVDPARRACHAQIPLQQWLALSRSRGGRYAAALSAFFVGRPRQSSILAEFARQESIPTIAARAKRRNMMDLSRTR